VTETTPVGRNARLVRRLLDRIFSTARPSRRRLPSEGQQIARLAGTVVELGPIERSTSLLQARAETHRRIVETQPPPRQDHAAAAVPALVIEACEKSRSRRIGASSSRSFPMASACVAPRGLTSTTSPHALANVARHDVVHAARVRLGNPRSCIRLLLDEFSVRRYEAPEFDIDVLELPPANTKIGVAEVVPVLVTIDR